MIENILDEGMLKEYCSMISASVFLNTVDLFNTTYVEYLQELLSAKENNDFENFVAQGHKLKGASASIGLSRIRDLAEKIQHLDKANWQEEGKILLDSINEHIQDDITVLVEYLEKLS